MAKLKVIGAGFGRTGTFSLKLSLEKLGFGPCYHMADVKENESHVQLWNDAVNGTYKWDEIFQGYSSTVDWPSTYFWRVLYENSPDAKIILSSRDEDSWYESAKSTIYLAMSNANKYTGLRRELYKMAAEIVLEKTFKGRFNDEKYAKKVYREHIEYVTASVNPGNLLKMNVSEGWEPLCKFLGVEIPDTDFPLTNTKEKYKKKL